MIRAAVLAFGALGVGTAGGAASPLVQLSGAAGCVSPRIAGCTFGGLGSSFAVTVAPDGRTVYVAGGTGSLGAMAILRRDPRSGALHTLPPKRGCVHVYTGSARCVGVRALETPSAIVVSPDRRYVYVAAASNSAVTTFARRADGSLVQTAGRAACIAYYGGRCATARALTHPESIALSPDGRSLYAVGNTAVVVLARDPASGRLTQLAGTAGCLNVRGAAGCARLTAGGRIFRGTVAVSPDGRNVYAATGGSLYAFQRDPASGALEQLACLDARGEAGCAATAGLGTPDTLAVSPDGRRVYVGGGRRSLAVLARDAATGEPAPLGSVALPFVPRSLAAVGGALYAGGDRGVAALRSTPSGGVLLGALTRLRGAAAPFAVAASRDGRSVYAVGRGGIAVLRAAP